MAIMDNLSSPNTLASNPIPNGPDILESKRIPNVTLASANLN